MNFTNFIVLFGAGDELHSSKRGRITFAYVNSFISRVPEDDGVNQMESSRSGAGGGIVNPK